MYSIAQHAVPNGSGHREFLRAHATRLSRRVVKKSEEPEGIESSGRELGIGENISVLKNLFRARAYPPVDDDICRFTRTGAARVKDRKGKRAAAPVPEAELEVLAALERLGTAEASVVRTALLPQRPLSHSSVVTLLQRLERRGLVTRRPALQGKAFVYSLRSPGGMGRQLRRLTARLFADDRVRMVSTLFEGDPPSKDEIDGLDRLIDAMRRESGKGKPS
jgi:predicted transcriptional regulator